MARSYRTHRRTAAVDQRRAAAVDATRAILFEKGFDAVTLQAVADRTGVSLKSIVRYFGTREGLFRACMRASIAREESSRVASPGDVAAIAHTLAQRYRPMADWIVHNAHIEFAYPVMEEWMANVRRSHRDWLATAFAPWLPRKGPVRERRLMALFWATEVRSWWAVSSAFGHGPATAEAVMRETLDALVASWTMNKRRNR